MALDPLNVVTPEILAMTWTNSDAVRMWLKRRGTTSAKLGLAVLPVDSPEGPRVRVVPAGAAGVAGADPAPTSEAFEAWAEEVDTLLVAANEGAESDAVLQELWEAETQPADAVTEIIARRADALERSVTAPEASCADCDDTRSCWGAPDKCEVRLSDREVAAVWSAPPAAEHMGRVLTPLPDALDAVVDQDGALDDGPLPGELEQSLGGGEVSGDLAPETEMPTAEQSVVKPEPAPVSERVADALVSASQLGELSELGFLAEVQGMLSAAIGDSRGEELHSDLAATTLSSLGRMVAIRTEYLEGLATAVAKAPRKKVNRSDRLPLIIEALERPSGASQAEMQELLGWDNAPGPWFFREWAKKAERINDLTDLGVVDGHRRFRLERRKRR
jgi:hypothetical protein